MNYFFLRLQNCCQECDKMHILWLALWIKNYTFMTTKNHTEVSLEAQHVIPALREGKVGRLQV